MVVHTSISWRRGSGSYTVAAAAAAAAASKGGATHASDRSTASSLGSRGLIRSVGVQLVHLFLRLTQLRLLVVTQVALLALRAGRNDLDAAWQYLESLRQRQVGEALVAQPTGGMWPPLTLPPPSQPAATLSRVTIYHYTSYPVTIMIYDVKKCIRNVGAVVEGQGVPVFLSLTVGGGGGGSSVSLDSASRCRGR